MAYGRHQTCDCCRQVRVFKSDDCDCCRNVLISTIVDVSDTTTTALTYLFYELCKDPQQAVSLRKELLDRFGERRDFNNSELIGCQHLNAVINETLRLHPPIPSGMIRVTPPEGIVVDGVSIPGEIHVCVPLYASSQGMYLAVHLEVSRSSNIF